MRPPLQPDDPDVTAYLAALERLDSAGWDRLVRVGRAFLKAARTRPVSDAMRGLADLPNAWSKYVIDGTPARPFKGTLLSPEDELTLLAVYEKAKDAAFLAYGAVRPEIVEPEDAETPAALAASLADRWAEQMTKATRIAAVGAALLSIKAGRAEWAGFWEPWQAVVDSVPAVVLFHGDWASVIHLGELKPIEPKRRRGLGRVFGGAEPRFGPATPEVEALLGILPRLDEAAWRRLEEMQQGFLTTATSLAEPAALRALVRVAFLGTALRKGDRALTDMLLVPAVEALQSAGLEAERDRLLRAFGAAAQAVKSGEAGRGESGRGEAGRGESGRGEAGRGESGRGESGRGESGRREAERRESERRDAAGLVACLLVLRRHLPPDVWARVWGGPLG